MADRNVDYQIFLKYAPLESSRVFDQSPAMQSGNGMPRDWVCRSTLTSEDIEESNYFKDMVFEFQYADRIDVRCANDEAIAEGEYRIYFVSSMPGKFPVEITRVYPASGPGPAPEIIAPYSVIANPNATSAAAVACAAGANIYFTGDGKINANGASGSMLWTEITGAAQVNAEIDNIYFYNGNFNGAVTLPPSAKKGQKFKIVNHCYDSTEEREITISQYAGQSILIGGDPYAQTTVGTAGHLKVQYPGVNCTLTSTNDTGTVWVLEDISVGGNPGTDQVFFTWD